MDRSNYRYTLSRSWDLSKPKLGWVLLNPSTADVETDDPTTRKLRGFAERWGFGSYLLVNLFPFRATDPRELIAATVIQRIGDPRLATDIIGACYLDMDEMVLAWGANGSNPGIDYRRQEVLDFLAEHHKANPKPVWCLGTTKSGDPRHPVRLGYDTPRVEWSF